MASSHAGSGLVRAVQFADADSEGAQGHTVLSVAAHALLPCFTTRDVLPLRGSCREARVAVAAHPWDDATKLTIAGHLREGTRVVGSLSSWRACFPKVRKGLVCIYLPTRVLAMGGGQA